MYKLATDRRIKMDSLFTGILLAGLCLSLLFLTNGGLVRAQDAAMEYAENGKDQVASFTAEDPEGATPIAWDIVENAIDPDGDDGDLTGDDNADAASFEIDKDGDAQVSATRQPTMGLRPNPPTSRSPRVMATLLTTPTRWWW